MPTSAVAFIILAALVLLGGAPFLVVFQRRRISIDREAVSLQRQGDDFIHRSLLEHQADLARAGTPEALRVREQIAHLIREMRVRWEASERRGRPQEDPQFLRKLASAMMATEKALKDAPPPREAMSPSDPQAQS